MERIDAWLAADDVLTSKDIAERVAEEFGFTVHPRSVERALSRRREPESAGEVEPISHRCLPRR
jgi:hypothetical protein